RFQKLNAFFQFFRFTLQPLINLSYLCFCKLFFLLYLLLLLLNFPQGPTCLIIVINNKSLFLLLFLFLQQEIFVYSHFITPLCSFLLPSFHANLKKGRDDM